MKVIKTPEGSDQEWSYVGKRYKTTCCEGVVEIESPDEVRWSRPCLWWEFTCPFCGSASRFDNEVTKEEDE